MATTQQTESSCLAEATRALDALRWAADVGTKCPELLSESPEPVEPKAWRELSVSEVRLEVDRLLLGKYTQEGLEALYQVRFLDAWLPEVASMVGLGDGEWRHKDVWKHTKQVVWQSKPRLAIRWGALLHDIGKPRTRKFEPNGKVSFIGHAELGASMFRKKVAGRLGFEGELRERIHFLILYHLRPGQYDDTWTDAAVRRFRNEMGDGLEDLLALSRADITTKRPERKKRILKMIADLAQHIRELDEIDSYVQPLPKGLGKAIMDRFGIPPSKRLGEIRDDLQDLCDDGVLKGQQDFEYYLAYLAENAEEFGL